jgi:hypothetical protein
MLQSHLVCVHLGNLLRDIVPLVLHGRMENVAVDVSVLEGQLQLLVSLLGASLELIQLGNQHLDGLRHFTFKRTSCLSIFSSNSTWTNFLLAYSM